MSHARHQGIPGRATVGLKKLSSIAGDANMNVTALVDTGGDVVERYVYDPYGRCTFLAADFSLQENGETDGIASNYANDILYCGYRFDNETGLYHVRHRYLHSRLGRWLSRDLIGKSDGMNSYQYVASSPVGRTDGLGLWGEEVHLDKTKEWAQEVQYNSECARVISEADNEVDNRLRWPSENIGPVPVIGDFSYHFDTDKTGRRKVPGARRSNAGKHLDKVRTAVSRGFGSSWLAVRNLLTEIGTALHPLQDISAHNEQNQASTPFDHAPSVYCGLPRPLRAWLEVTDEMCAKAKQSNPNWDDPHRPDKIGLGGPAEQQCKKTTQDTLREFMDQKRYPQIYCYCYSIE